MPTEPSRRSVLRSAAWSAPVIVAASAAPALASSPATGSLTFTRGDSFYNSTHLPDYNNAGVFFVFASLMAIGPTIAPFSLRASITSSDPDSHLAGNPPSVDWSFAEENVGDIGGTFTFIYRPEIQNGQSIDFANYNQWSFDETNAPDPTFTVRFEAPGYEPTGDIFTPPSN